MKGSNPAQALQLRDLALQHKSQSLQRLQACSRYSGQRSHKQHRHRHWHTYASSPAAPEVLRNPQAAVSKWLQDSSSEAQPKIHPDSPVHSSSISKTEAAHQHSPIRPPEWLAHSPGMLVAFNVAQAILLAVITISLVRWLAHRAKQADEEDSTKRAAGVLKPTTAAARMTVMALNRPLQLYVVLQCLLHVASLLADYADHLPQHTGRSPVLRFASMFRRSTGQASGAQNTLQGVVAALPDQFDVHKASQVLRLGDRLLDVGFKVVCVIFTASLALRLKERWVQSLLDRRAANATNDMMANRQVDQLLLPLSSALSWLIVLAGIGMVLHLLQINLIPFATAGGVGGIVLGFASQSVLANIVAGSNLLITRPLVVGDRVTLAGGVQLTGIVEQIDFTRTIIRNDVDVPVSVPNKVLSDTVIHNESRIEMSPVRTHYGGPRQLDTKIKLRASCIDRIPDIVSAIRNYLITKCEGVDSHLPITVGLKEAMQDHTCTIVVTVNAEAMHARRFTTWRQNVLLGLYDVVKSKGGSFAHHIYNVNYNIETDLGHMEGRLAEI